MTDIALTPEQMETLFQSTTMAILNFPVQLAASTVVGSATISGIDTSKLKVDMYVTDQQGAIPPNTKVLKVESSDVILSNNAFANTNQELITFGDYSLVRIGWMRTGQPMQNSHEDVIYVRAIQADNQYDRIRDTLVSDYDEDNILQTTTYTRVWEIFWTLYGPNSFDRARLVHSGLMSDQGSHDVLALSNVYAVTDIMPPRRVPEQRDGQWWERSDFSMMYNEQVTEYRIVPSVKSVEILIETQRGQASDFTVTKGS
jgi:hypothetical protein